MQTWQANQGSLAGIGGAVGQIGGAILANPGTLAALAATSDENAKENRKPARGILGMVEKMPVEEWDYKPGVEDGGRHVGPMAQDFQAATGKGDGRSIPMVDAFGVTLGAVQELAAKVDRLERKGRGITRAAA